MSSHVIKMTLSPTSVLEAWGKMNRYVTALKRAVILANSALKEDAKKVLEAYISASYVHDVDDSGHSVKVTATDTDKGFILTATGDQIGFLEFGTGQFVDAAHEFVGNAPFNVWSGSWSDDHGKTWQAYLKYGAFADKNGQYIYNRYPKYPLYYTSEWIREHWSEYLRKEIERIGIS